MNLLETPDQGEVYIDKVELTQLSKKKLEKNEKYWDDFSTIQSFQFKNRI